MIDLWVGIQQCNEILKQVPFYFKMGLIQRDFIAAKSCSWQKLCVLLTVTLKDVKFGKGSKNTGIYWVCFFFPSPLLENTLKFSVLGSNTVQPKCAESQISQKECGFLGQCVVTMSLAKGWKPMLVVTKGSSWPPGCLVSVSLPLASESCWFLAW